MKSNILFILCKLSIVFLTFFSLLSCEKEENNDSNSKQDTVSKSQSSKGDEKADVYYIKYELSLNYESGNNYRSPQSFYFESTTGNSGNNLTFEKIEKGKTFTWEETYGPFKEGSIVTLKCTKNDDHTYCNISGKGKIFMKKNEDPFAVKAEGSIFWYYLGSYCSWHNLEIEYVVGKAQSRD